MPHSKTIVNSYDPHCHVLAEYFLGGVDGPDKPKLMDDLAQTIQDSIETWFKDNALYKEPE